MALQRSSPRAQDANQASSVSDMGLPHDPTFRCRASESVVVREPCAMPVSDHDSWRAARLTARNVHRNLVVMPAPTFLQSYDAKTNIVDVSFPKVHLETRVEIRAHFDRVLAFWRDHCAGKKVYYVVNY